MKYIKLEEYKKETLDVIKILTRKLDNWKHEDEFRFLIESDKNEHEIGKITKIYFGDPYGDLGNGLNIKKRKSLKKYDDLKEEIKKFVEDKGIKTDIFYF